MLLEHIGTQSQKSNTDLNAFSENENRYEPNQELKWLGNFLVDALVLCKHDLKIEDNVTSALVIDAMWRTLDYHNIED